MTAALILGILGLVLGVALALASKAFHVDKDERIEQVEKILPQANCGACGYAGCAAFAEAVINGTAPISGCVPGGASVAEKISGIVGKKAGKTVKKVAVVHCGGNINSMREKFRYNGIEDCNAAALLHGGDNICAYGCLGLMSCMKACPFGAISASETGLPVIDEEKCVACGICVETCPKNIIGYKIYGKKVDVRCSSRDKGAAVMKICRSGCIGCGKCEKTCPVGAIDITDNLAVIDYEKCVSCGKCAEVCPTKAITDELLDENTLKRASPVIIEDKCIGCTICAKNCPVSAIKGEVKQVHEIDEDICICCGICVDKCPKSAIDWELKGQRTV